MWTIIHRRYHRNVGNEVFYEDLVGVNVKKNKDKKFYNLEKNSSQERLIMFRKKIKFRDQW